MENRDKLIKKVASFLKLPEKQVKQVINCNHLLLRQTMQQRKQRTFYLRKVGFFIPEELRYKLKAEKIKRSQQQKSINQEAEKFPLEFE